MLTEFVLRNVHLISHPSHATPPCRRSRRAPSLPSRPFASKSLRVRSNPTLAHVSPPAATSAHITLASWPPQRVDAGKSLSPTNTWRAPSYELVPRTSELRLVPHGADERSSAPGRCKWSPLAQIPHARRVIVRARNELVPVWGEVHAQALFPSSHQGLHAPPRAEIPHASVRLEPHGRGAKARRVESEVVHRSAVPFLAQKRPHPSRALHRRHVRSKPAVAT